MGDAVTWDGKHLFVCARKAELRDGMLEFVDILSGREWTWQKRLGNPKISGMSLLGTVEGCSGETVRLLDIDRGRPAQLSMDMGSGDGKSDVSDAAGGNTCILVF